MPTQQRVIKIGAEARKGLTRGALTVGEAVGMSLGWGGRNAIIKEAYSAPKVTNDGVTIARNIVLKDEIEDLGAQMIVEAAMKTNSRVGDGTTTTTVIACEIIKDVSKKIEVEDGNAKASGLSGGADVVGIAREILDTKDKVIEKLKSKAKELKKGDLKNIIATSLGKVYPEYVDSLTEAINTVGKDGYISIEDNWSTQYGVDSTISEGMRFRGSYATPFMVTNKNKEAILEDVKVLVTNHRIESLVVIQELLQEMNQRKIKKLVIIAEGYSAGVIRVLMSATEAARSGDPRFVNFIAVKAPSLTTEQFYDVVAYTGGKFFDKNTSQDSTVITAKVDDLGYVKKVIVDEDDTRLIEGKGDVKARIQQLKHEMETEKDPSFKEQTKRRIGALASGFVIIRIGASTEPERRYIKDKMEDAKNAAKAALDEGYIQGGGVPLVEIAEELGEKNVLYNALKSPYERIKSNAGGIDMKVPANIIDPVKVTRLAVENACSVAAQLITSEVAITDKDKSLVDELQRAVGRKEDDSDFRSPENEDVGYLT